VFGISGTAGISGALFVCDAHTLAYLQGVPKIFVWPDEFEIEKSKGVE
jgi:hypothetical protein